MLVTAALFLILHLPNGYEVVVAIDGIVSMRENEGKDNLTKKAGCLINTNDGKFISVFETCQQVREMIKDAQK